MRLLVGLRSFTGCWRLLAMQFCSLQAGRSPSGGRSEGFNLFLLFGYGRFEASDGCLEVSPLPKRIPTRFKPSTKSLRR
jgi:hypothetical protein